MLTRNEVYTRLHSALWADVIEEDRNPPPKYLFHYTNVSVLESFLKGGALWMSNPLHMTDIEELRFGMDLGMQTFLSSAAIAAALPDAADLRLFNGALASLYQDYSRDHVADTFVACFSAHSFEEDGLLSMWRAYGDQGRGVAIVLDTTPVERRENLALIFAPVHYGTTEERRNYLSGLADKAANLTSGFHGDEVRFAAEALFHRLKAFALFTKHRGFSEEKEWRIVYMPERDATGILRPYISYAVTARGMQPKMKLPIKPIDGAMLGDIRLESLVHRVILGPSHSSMLSRRAAELMLVETGHPELVPKLTASSIPFRDGGLVW